MPESMERDTARRKRIAWASLALLVTFAACKLGVIDFVGRAVINFTFKVTGAEVQI